MRFEKVDLVRYGRFAGRHLRFPHQACDFHLVLGRNEAGKSTLRQAFHDLLFGIPMNTPMSFLHAGTELELGAQLSGQPGTITFGRRRKRNGGLVDAHGQPLAPDALRPWLGEVGEAFYERMFGLDHLRLAQGGRAMLQASDNVDSVLFQAAEGMLALNDVLASLQQEAAALWTPRKSRERAWYAAATRLSEAEAALKEATVRPTAWADAAREHRRLDDAFAQAEERHTTLLAEVREFERLRRSAPLLAQIRQYEARLAESSLEGATALLLQYGADILRVEQMRLRVADHRDAIQRTDAHIEFLWSRLGGVLRQLGRSVPSSDSHALEGLAEQLPPRPLRREVELCLQEGRQVRAQCDDAGAALEVRRAELEHVRRQIASLPAVTVSPELRQAVDAVTAAGDLDARLVAARQAVERERGVLLRRLQSLAQPGVEVPTDVAPAIDWLGAMQACSSGSLVEWAQRRQRLQGDIDALVQRMQEMELQRQAAQVELEQFRRSRDLVSREQVLAARRERDAAWEALVQGETSLEMEAGRFGALLQRADNLADLHLQGVDDAARLQALQHEHERWVAGLGALQASHDAAVQALARHEDEWAAACTARGLPVLPPADLQSWQAEREAVLTANDRLAGAEAEASALANQHDALLRRILAALEGEGRSIESAATLAAARDAARELLRAAEQGEARREALTEQQARIEAQLPALEKEFERRKSDLVTWQARWQDALMRAGLPADADAAFVDTSIALLADADELASQLRESYADRSRMAAELGRYAEAAAQLASQLQHGAFDPKAVDTQVRHWVAALERARTDERERDEARRRLAELNDALLHEGEGRSREQIEAELADIDVSTLKVQSEARAAALEQAAAARTALAVEREQARQALEAISGGDAAAVAAACRQEALADMADIAERYVRLHVEARLLERVMERYRDRRQGPLLERAGRLFSELTLGAHAGLLVDVDEAHLHARRADGSLVPLEGLSDGTRDQLYLALRLAALELYLDSAAPMPFIADDLFINYDDQRAVAGLRQLAAIAQRTQVIFLTHHAHMVELAREALQGQANVMELRDDP